MITEDYVSFEVAKLLKEKGFDECIFEFYEGNKIKYARNGKGFKLSELDSYIYYPHITHQMAMKWLREEANILITINVGYYDAEEVRKYDWNVCRMHKNRISYPLLEEPMPTQTYEDAVEAALKYSLENLETL